MIAVDTNILVYAHRRDSTWHDAAYARMTELAESRSPWCIPWQCLHEFIAIVTHPAHRGRGLGKAAVSAIARIALARGLVAQYRTLCANTPSMAIARALGFQRFATTLAIRG